MSYLSAVPESPAEEDAQLELFEGEVISRYRLNCGSTKEFACIDLENNPLKLNRGDRVVIQLEAEVHKVTFGGKTNDRLHIAETTDGTQAVVKVIRRES